jgi:hypothetical protein
MRQPWPTSWSACPPRLVLALALDAGLPGVDGFFFDISTGG